MGRGNFVQAGVMESFALSALAAFAGGALAFYRHAFCRWCRAICVLPPDYNLTN